MMQRFNQPHPPVPVHIAHLYPPGDNEPALREGHGARSTDQGQHGGCSQRRASSEWHCKWSSCTIRLQRLRMRKAQRLPKSRISNRPEAAAAHGRETSESHDEELADDEPPTIKLGDASVAAPFTSKLANVIAIPNIIRQGSIALVATIQMYKILALNCLISAYSLSVLYLDGIKFGDGQVTISGMLMSVCFLTISRAKVRVSQLTILVTSANISQPVEGLSKERPQPNILNCYVIPSVLGQFAVHIVTLIYISHYVHRIEAKEDRAISISSASSSRRSSTAPSTSSSSSSKSPPSRSTTKAGPSASPSERTRPCTGVSWSSPVSPSPAPPNSSPRSTPAEACALHHRVQDYYDFHHGPRLHGLLAHREGVQAAVQ